MRTAISYVFILAVLLIAAAYYVGLKTDATVVGQQVNSLLQTATGRDPTGKFAAYPNGANGQN